MRDTVYRLKHPQADFRGFFGGVDFYAGYGTTSSKATVIFLLDAGQGFKVCGLTPEERAELESFRVAHAPTAAIKQPTAKKKPGVVVKLL